MSCSSSVHHCLPWIWRSEWYQILKVVRGPCPYQTTFTKSKSRDDRILNPNTYFHCTHTAGTEITMPFNLSTPVPVVHQGEDLTCILCSKAGIPVFSYFLVEGWCWHIWVTSPTSLWKWPEFILSFWVRRYVKQTQEENEERMRMRRWFPEFIMSGVICTRKQVGLL